MVVYTWFFRLIWYCCIACDHPSSGSQYDHRTQGVPYRTESQFDWDPFTIYAILGTMIWCVVYLRFTHSSWSWRLWIYRFSGSSDRDGMGAAWSYRIGSYFIFTDVLHYNYTLIYYFPMLGWYHLVFTMLQLMVSIGLKSLFLLVIFETLHQWDWKGRGVIVT